MGAANSAQPAIASKKQAARTATYPRMVLPGQSLFNFIRFPWQRGAQDPGAVLGDEDHVLDSNADALFRNVDAGLHRDYHTGFERGRDIRIVNVDADGVSQTVREILAQRSAVQIFAV